MSFSFFFLLRRELTPVPPRGPGTRTFSLSHPRGILITGSRGGGGGLPIVDYTGRLRPNGVPFSDWRYVEG